MTARPLHIPTGWALPHGFTGGPDPADVPPGTRCGTPYAPGLAAAACPGSLVDRTTAALVNLEALALDARAARQAATGAEKTRLRYVCNALDDGVVALRKAASK